MFIAHYGVAFAARKANPRTSLGTLALAAQWLDLVWPIFVLLGLERVEVAPRNTVVAPLAFVHYPLSHSLLAAVGWASLLAGLHKIARPDSRAVSWIWTLVLSHWILDAVSHRPDLPLYPGSLALIGLGLWNSRAATLLIEGALFVLGVALYRQATWARDTIGVYAFRSLVALLALMYLGSVFGPPPPSSNAVAITGLGQWLLIFWAYWVDRHREATLINVLSD